MCASNHRPSTVIVAFRCVSPRGWALRVVTGHLGGMGSPCRRRPERKGEMEKLRRRVTWRREVGGPADRRSSQVFLV